jgi:basic membrane protein A
LDSSAEGLERATSELGVEGKVIEGGANQSAAWKSNLENLSNGDYDLVVVGSALAADQLTEVAARHTEQRYVSIDQEVDLENVASITFRQSDGAFLAGVAAALATTDQSAFPLSSGSKNVGFIGGSDIPVIRDFLAGFEGGAKAVDPAITVQSSYVGNFTDAQTAYNQATSMIAAGADAIFAAAGGGGLGALKAASEKGKYGIGVDSNQNGLYPEAILASDLKNSGNALFAVISMLKDGTLETGKNYVFGISNGGVELIVNEDLVPEESVETINAFIEKVKDGEIEVPCVDPYCAPSGA